MTRNAIFLWPFLQIITTLNENNNLVSGLLGEKINMEMIDPKIERESPNTSEGIPVSLPFAIPKEIQDAPNKMGDRGSTGSTVELKETLIHQRQVPGQN